ncbi:hypothetical protein NQ317_013401 [Molorchus minor]|uniref:Dehydrogenase E1 component domain-containing protein n=1 Tax=Molorchus minor TaxID=1323400 RepID=A0ABQ9IPN8_9CUCU|nr:hypothetical protein NQ317_013401 [Molorchus minor]
MSLLWEGFRYAIDCASGKGPLVIEAATYRYSGPSMSDPGTITAEELKKIEGEIRAEVDEANKKAKADKEVGLDELAGDIYTVNLEGNIRNIDHGSSRIIKRIGPAVNV